MYISLMASLVADRMVAGCHISSLIGRAHTHSHRHTQSQTQTHAPVQHQVSCDIYFFNVRGVSRVRDRVCVIFISLLFFYFRVSCKTCHLARMCYLG